MQTVQYNKALEIDDLSKPIPYTICRGELIFQYGCNRIITDFWHIEND